MPRNIEIKAAVPDFEPLIQTLQRITSAQPERLRQEDTFFACPCGRLKLRKFSASSGELIHYARTNEAGPKESNYIRVPTSEPDRLCEALTAAMGTIGVVVKDRTVYMAARTRVHLDEVEGLGKFIELEVVLGESESADDGIAEAQRLMAVLGIDEQQLISCAYIDLL